MIVSSFQILIISKFLYLLPGVAITPFSQIDSLDTLALLGDRERFAASVEWIGKNLRFDIVSNGSFFFFLHSRLKLVGIGFRVNLTPLNNDYKSKVGICESQFCLGQDT
jgi:hypothetical protein